MRILYIINANGLAPQLGGSIIRTANIARRIAALGHETYVVTTRGGKEACLALGFETTFHMVPASLFGRREKYLWQRAIGYVISAFWTSAIICNLPAADVVYSDSDQPCDVLPASLYQKFRHGKWVAIVHHILEAEQRDPGAGMLARFKRFVQEWGHRRIATQATAAFVYDTEAGRFAGRKLASYGLDEGRLAFVNNGIDLDEIRTVRRSNVSFTACLVGHLRPGKGLKEVLPIWKRVVERDASARLALVGSLPKPQLDWLNGKIAENQLERNVTLLGQLSHAETIAVIKSSEIMVAPSLEEGWGIAVCEALACGVPVVAYDLPAYRSLFRVGLRRVALHNHEEFAREVLSLMRDSDERTALGNAASLDVQRFDWSRAAEKDLEILLKVAGQTSRSPGHRTASIDEKNAC